MIAFCLRCLLLVQLLPLIVFCWGCATSYGKLISDGKGSQQGLQQVYQASTYAVLLPGLVSGSKLPGHRSESIQSVCVCVCVCVSHTQPCGRAISCVCACASVLPWPNAHQLLQGIDSNMPCLPFRSANSSKAAVPSTVTTRLSLPLVSFQKPLLQVLVCIPGVQLHIVVCLTPGFRV